MVANRPGQTLIKFPLSDVTGLRDYYRENRYVVIENLVPADASRTL